jgi:hypothetical protein
LQCLQQENVLQKHRILLLELQAKHVDLVHKTHTNCLQSVSSLRIEVSLNLIVSAIIVSHVELTLCKGCFVSTLVYLRHVHVQSENHKKSMKYRDCKITASMFQPVKTILSDRS